MTWTRRATFTGRCSSARRGEVPPPGWTGTCGVTNLSPTWYPVEGSRPTIRSTVTRYPYHTSGSSSPWGSSRIWPVACAPRGRRSSSSRTYASPDSQASSGRCSFTIRPAKPSSSRHSRTTHTSSRSDVQKRLPGLLGQDKGAARPEQSPEAVNCGGPRFRPEVRLKQYLLRVRRDVGDDPLVGVVEQRQRVGSVVTV